MINNEERMKVKNERKKTNVRACFVRSFTHFHFHYQGLTVLDGGRDGWFPGFDREETAINREQ